MLQDDVIFCGCGHIHVVSGKDYSDAIEAGKENLLICGNCGVTYISGAEEAEGGYSLKTLNKLVKDYLAENHTWCKKADGNYHFEIDVDYRDEIEDSIAQATHAEKTFLAHLIEAGVRAVLEGGDFCSISTALEYMFVSWDSDNEGRHLSSYLTFYRPFARLCGKEQEVEL